MVKVNQGSKSIYCKNKLFGCLVSGCLEGCRLEDLLSFTSAIEQNPLEPGGKPVGHTMSFLHTTHNTLIQLAFKSFLVIRVEREAPF